MGIFIGDGRGFMFKLGTAGISFGSCLSMIISYTAWESIIWAIVHGLFSWAYVIYYFIVHYNK